MCRGSRVWQRCLKQNACMQCSLRQAADRQEVYFTNSICIFNSCLMVILAARGWVCRASSGIPTAMYAVHRRVVASMLGAEDPVYIIHGQQLAAALH